MTDDAPELLPHVQADADQLQAEIVDAFPELFQVDDCGGCEAVTILYGPAARCRYHQGVHDALAAIVDEVGTAILDCVRTTEDEVGPICEGARGAIAIVGLQHVAWLQAAADRLGDGT